MYGDIKRYKMLIIIPLAILFLSMYLFMCLEDVKKDIDLTGGMQIMILMEKDVNAKEIENILKEYEVKVRVAKSFEKTTVFIQYTKNITAEEIVEKIKKYGYEVLDYSTQQISPALAKEFYKQMINAIIIAFIFMSIVVFFIFREILPSFYVIFTIAIDIFEAFVFSQFFGIPLSIASIAGFLLLIGYSVDANILLTARVLKSENGIKENLEKAFKTGITMAITTITALLVIVIISSSSVLKQIASVLLIGLVLDIINTWFINGVVLRWWVERKK